MRFLLFVVMIFSFGAVFAESLREVQLDDTFICYPTKFSPDYSSFDAFSSVNDEAFDSSGGQEPINIPARIIKTMVPEYTLSHINRYGVNFQHDLTGLMWASSQIGKPNGMAEAAWNVHQRVDSAHVDKDPNLPFYRIYEYGKQSSIWDLVLTEPPENPGQAVPEDWYIGQCLKSAGSFSCSQSTQFESIFFSYDLQAVDIHLHSQVAEAVKSLFREWNRNCEES